MKTPLKAGLVLLVSASVILGGALLLIQGPILEEEKGWQAAGSGSGQTATITAGAEENGGFAGLAARTVKKSG